MLYSKLGKTKYEVSSLGFGAMRLPKSNGSYDVNESVRLIRKSIDLGVNVVDTAPTFYCGGESERIVGRALKDGYRERVYLSTKNLTNVKDTKKWRGVLEQSLKDIETDYIDFYYFWSKSLSDYERVISGNDGLLEKAIRAKEEGLIRAIVLSTHDKPPNISKLIETGDFEAVLLQYNLMNPATRDCIKTAHEREVGVFVMNPASGGRLEEDSMVVKKLEERFEMSIWEIAFRYVLAEEGVNCALSGMSDIEMVIGNTEYAGKGGLTKDDVLAIDGFVQLIREKAYNCTSCAYCLPCPEKISIPTALELLLMYKAWDLEEKAREMFKGYLKFWGISSLTDACTECGECIEKCPSGLDIPQLLKEAQRVLGDE